MSAAANSLFRYMAVRPVQTLDHRREQYRFLRPPDSLTPFRARLKGATSWVEARNIAAAYIASDEWLGNRLETDDRLLILRRVYGAMKEAAAAGDASNLPELISKIIETILDLDSLSSLNDDLWDGLIACYAAPRVQARDRAAFLECLRSLHFIQHRDDFESIDNLQHLVGATALIPKWIGAGSDTGEPGDTSPKDPTPGGPGPVVGTPIETIRGLRKQVLQIDAALDDLEMAYASARRQARAPKPTAAKPKKPTRPSTGDHKNPKRPVLVVHQPSRPPWTNSVVRPEELKPETVSILDGIDPVWSYRSQDDTLDQLESRRSTFTSELRRLGGAGALSGLKSRTVPVDRDIILTDDFNLPTGVIVPDVFTGSIEGSVGSIRPVGIGDLLIVKEYLLGYEEGEIATVENVMNTESKERTFRKLDRTTTTTFTATETTETTERDLQSTQRYEMQTETSETISSEVAIDTGVNISASYGPFVQVDASADFSVDNATETSTTSASNFAQDIVEKSVSNLTQRLKEEITVKVLSETEETSTHGFKNDTGEHVIGIYRWLNKLYQAQVFNYGKRLLIECIVPEPAAFYRYAQQFGINSDPTLRPPEPLEEGFTYTDIEPTNYKEWVGRYQVTGVNPAPIKSKVVGKVIEIPSIPTEPYDPLIKIRSDSLAIPTGYIAKEAWVNSNGILLEHASLQVTVGQHVLSSDAYTELDDEETTVPLGVVGIGYDSAVITIEARCERSTETLKSWQLETFQKIVDTYKALQSEYEAAVKAKENSQLSTLTGIPAEAKRKIELAELKKGCLQIFTDQHFYDFNATVADAEPFGYPEFQIDQALEEGRYAQFFEQCFEWENATWVYYPYFWGRKDQWVVNSSVTDSDPVFESFLRAGAARVQVPVRPGYGKALLYYLHSGEVWNGGEAPVLDSPLYVSLVEEITESQDVALDKAEQYGEPWTYTLPTTLVKLQREDTLPTWTMD